MKLIVVLVLLLALVYAVVRMDNWAAVRGIDSPPPDSPPASSAESAPPPPGSQEATP